MLSTDRPSAPLLVLFRSPRWSASTFLPPSLSLSPSPYSHLSLFLSLSRRPDRVALLPYHPARPALASTNPLPCRPASSRCPPFTSLSHEPASLTFHPHRISTTTLMSSYSISLPLFSHTCTANEAPHVSTATQRWRRQPGTPRNVSPSRPSPCLSFESMYRPRRLMPACCVIYSRAVLVLSIRLPSPPFLLSSNLFSSTARHVPPCLSFSLTLFSPLRVSLAEPACLSAYLAGLTGCLARLLTCMLVRLLGC